ncbi:hypothetical protein [Pontibacter sp. HSC-36F09]|uniref:hypothetical protein n=1 Tax=Pontibacter sp. HSC-36F09 TaxID=2910966 RepID=UPI00209D9D50|nr:hypothetical protein [Pontibacter sp. HSC-36F09]MCP2045055.1 hypothetical protein [Pontibacter sp. HSC-36F09]
MKKKLIYIFAFIGLIATVKVIYDFIKEQSEASQYLSVCENVKVGMTLEEAKKVMGDYEYYRRRNRSEIWTSFNNSTEKTYYLTYPAVFLASTGTEIYFDPDTQLVTKVVCGE